MGALASTEARSSVEKEPFCRGGFAAWFGHLSRWLYAALLPLVLPTFRGRIQALFSSRLGISLAVFSDLFYFPATRILTWYQSPGKEIRADKQGAGRAGGILEFCKNSLVTRIPSGSTLLQESLSLPYFIAHRVGSRLPPCVFILVFFKAILLVLLE